MEIQKKAVDLTDLAIGLVVLGIVVSIGAYILTTLRDTKLTDLTSYTTTNETVTPSTTGDSLTNTWCKGVTSCINATDGSAIASSNYTVTINDFGVCTLTNNSNYGLSAGYKCTYDSYNLTSRADYELANDAAVGIGEYGNWFKIIVIVGAAAVVLALIFMAFGRGSMSAGGTSGGSY
jgi:hypothetical protein